MAQSEVIVGADGGLRGVLERVQLIAGSDAPVLLMGETGTGKEVVARAIHDRSPRRSGPFWRVNCGALAPELIDTELFGHERGAFTSAVNQRKGWFEQAHGGTLFLDEIAELTLAAQVRLLRVVQEGELLRVGGEEPVRVNVRIVAATHRNLAAMVGAHAFREDLYYRLHVFPIVIPPLRDRPGDIGALAAYFAARAATRFGLRPTTVSPRDVELLALYEWPGNVRELATVIDRAVLLGEGQRLDVAAALGIGGRVVRPRADLASGAVAEPPSDVIEQLDVIVRRHVERALRAAHGRVEGPFGAARLLGLNAHTLRGRMRKLQIDWRTFRPR